MLATLRGPRKSCDSIFFFFQAEDGIRDRNVTGVQTCAPSDLRGGAEVAHHRSNGRQVAGTVPTVGAGRSEERRVGKECRARGSPDHSKENLMERFVDAAVAIEDRFCVMTRAKAFVVYRQLVAC